MSSLKIETVRHSLAHVMAYVLKKRYADIQFGVGPSIETGFYYDFKTSKKLSDEDLEVIEKDMKVVIEKGLKFVKKELDIKEAIKLFRSLDQPYKVELLKDLEKYGTTSKVEIDELKEVKKDNKGKITTATIYVLGENVDLDNLKKQKDEIFIDLCKGPHVRNTSVLPLNFKLNKLSGAYFRGTEENDMLTRITGISFLTSTELKDYLLLLKEAEERDHRKLGAKLDLFSNNENVGLGLILWHPNGAAIRNEIECFWKKEHIKRGYELIYTPHIANVNLWKVSGHLEHYKESMYASIKQDKKEEFQLKPMNCPFHLEIFKSQIRSYKDLPIRYAELGTVYRYEKSGQLHGLTRVRGFTQDDSHIFCTLEQLEEEIIGVLKLAKYMMLSFGMKDYKVFLSTRPKDYIGEIKVWKKAEEILENALKKTDTLYEVAKGDGAFYGPKIDIATKDFLGKYWQGPTIQVDFNLPERFDINYINAKSEKERVVMVHRTVIGSMERFMGCLIEKYKGAFPLWLSPKQVAILPIGEGNIEYALKVKEELDESEIRNVLMDENETLGKKIRKAELLKIPYILVLGKKEEENNVVSVRERGKGDVGIFSVKELIEKLNDEIKHKTIKE